MTASGVATLAWVILGGAIGIALLVGIELWRGRRARR